MTENWVGTMLVSTSLLLVFVVLPSKYFGEENFVEKLVLVFGQQL